MAPAAQTPPRLGRRPALDGMRGLAVMLVIGIHVGLLTAGFVGVDVFLPLSGFLITVLLYEERERTGRISLQRFFGRRARRLLPALAVLAGGFSLVMLLLHPFNLPWPLGRLMASTVLFANNWVCTFVPAHGHVLSALSPTWTLAQEGQFYLLWPPILWLLMRRGVRPRVVLALVAAAIAASLGAGVLLNHLIPIYNPYTSPFSRGAELLFGAAAALAWRERLVPALLRHPLTGWALAGGLVALVATARPALPAWYLTAAALSALLIVHLLDGSPATALGHVLAWRPLVYTGRISYGIYLFHVPVYYLLWTYLPVASPAEYWALVLTVTLGVASASWRLVESPILRAGRRPRAHDGSRSPSYRRRRRRARSVIATATAPATATARPAPRLVVRWWAPGGGAGIGNSSAARTSWGSAMPVGSPGSATGP